MARQDITMDAEYGEVETSGNIAGKTFYECRLLDSVEGADNDNYRYCEIVVPAGFMLSYSDSKASILFCVTHQIGAFFPLL